MTERSAARLGGRTADTLRPIVIEANPLKHPAGSALVAFGDTRVLCAASVDEKVPPFLSGRGRGWVTAEYSMLPASTHSRASRESSRGRVGGRTHEIQRLIGRSLRAALDLDALGERTIWLDCDVLQADGGTRTASITGAWVALALALNHLLETNKLGSVPLIHTLAAISVGIVGNEARLDLCYEEDSSSEVDMNVVMTGAGQFVEIQGTAEGAPFTAGQLKSMLALAEKGIAELIEIQQRALCDAGVVLHGLRNHS